MIEQFRDLLILVAIPSTPQIRIRLRKRNSFRFFYKEVVCWRNRKLFSFYRKMWFLPLKNLSFRRGLLYSTVFLYEGLILPLQVGWSTVSNSKSVAGWVIEPNLYPSL